MALHAVWSSPVPLLVIAPTTGTAPLTVNISTNRAKDPGGREFIDYGDGMTEKAQGAADPHETHTFSHVYTKPGTYTITFVQQYIYDRTDPTYANHPEVFTQSGAQSDPNDPTQVLVPHPLGSETIIVQ